MEDNFKSPKRNKSCNNSLETERNKVLTCIRDTNSDLKNKRLYQEYLMNYAETLVIKNKINEKLMKYEDLKFMICGKDKFEIKNNFCDQHI